MTFLMMLSVMLLSMLMILLFKCDQASDLWQQLELVSELESDLRDTADWGKKWLVDFHSGKLSWFRLTSLIRMILLM